VTSTKHPEPTVHVVLLEDPGESRVIVAACEAALTPIVAAWCRENWGAARERDDGLPQNAPGDDNDAIAAFWDAMSEDEDWHCYSHVEVIHGAAEPAAALPESRLNPVRAVAETIGLSLLRWTRLVDDNNELTGTSAAVEAFAAALEHISIPDACETMASAREDRA
jgi:hypothetical protein